jgi:hypothetical protein
VVWWYIHTLEIAFIVLVLCEQIKGLESCQTTQKHHTRQLLSLNTNNDVIIVNDVKHLKSLCCCVRCAASHKRSVAPCVSSVGAMRGEEQHSKNTWADRLCPQPQKDVLCLAPQTITTTRLVELIASFSSRSL